MCNLYERLEKGEFTRICAGEVTETERKQTWTFANKFDGTHRPHDENELPIMTNTDLWDVSWTIVMILICLLLITIITQFLTLGDRLPDAFKNSGKSATNLRDM